MRRDQLPMHVKPNFVMERHKAAYIATSKAACTSLKWLVADIQGEDPERFRRATSKMVSRDMTIHQRSLWKRTPSLHQLSDAKLADVHPDNGWFVFTVVRHPSARFFSAWQSKLLLREPRWVGKAGDKPWFPRLPRSTDDIVEDFRRFALAMAEDPGQAIMRDRHFMPQFEESAPDRVPYTRVYDTSEIRQLLVDFEAHLRANGFEGEMPALRRTNETPLQPVSAVFSPEVREAISSLYADDFRAFGYDGVMPPKLHAGDEYPSSVFDEIARLAERNERIGDLSERVRELQALLRERDTAERPARTLLRRLTRR